MIRSIAPLPEPEVTELPWSDWEKATEPFPPTAPADLIDLEAVIADERHRRATTLKGSAR